MLTSASTRMHVYTLTHRHIHKLYIFAHTPKPKAFNLPCTALCPVWGRNWCSPSPWISASSVNICLPMDICFPLWIYASLWVSASPVDVCFSCGYLLPCGYLLTRWISASPVDIYFPVGICFPVVFCFPCGCLLAAALGLKDFSHHQIILVPLSN